MARIIQILMLNTYNLTRAYRGFVSNNLVFNHLYLPD